MTDTNVPPSTNTDPVPWTPPEFELVPAFDIDVPFVPDMSLAARKAFRKALATAQKSYLPAERTKEVKIKPRGDAPAYTFKYAELADVIGATKALSINGISVSQPVVEDKSNVLWLYTILAHEDGGGQVTRIRLMGGSDMKAFGGEITYLRRYCFGPAVGIATEDDADDNGDGGGRGDDDGGYRRERDEPTPAPAPSVQRRSASAAPKPPASAEEAPAAPKKALPGAVKNLQTKIAALALPEDEYQAMLKELGVPAVGPDMLNDDWIKVKAEVDRRMAS